MRVVTTGSRTWDRPDVIQDVLNILAREAFATGDDQFLVVHGACPKGADAHVDAWAHQQMRLWPIWVEHRPARWDEFGRRAGFVRNQAMIGLGADLVVGFVRDGSRGASHTLRLAEEAGIPTRVIDYADIAGPAVAR